MVAVAAKLFVGAIGAGAGAAVVGAGGAGNIGAGGANLEGAAGAVVVLIKSNPLDAKGAD